MKAKQKRLPKERNPFMASALFRKAGAHDKTNKAKRRNEKQNLMKTLGDKLDNALTRLHRSASPDMEPTS